MSFLGLLANSVGQTGPEVNAIAVVAIVILFAGQAAPGLYLVALIGGLAYALVVGRFAQSISSASGLEAFIRASAGRALGHFAGVAYAMGMGVYVAGMAVLGATTLPLVLARIFPAVSWFSHGHWFEWFVIILGVVAAVAYLGVRLSVRVLLAMSAFGVLVVLGLDLSIAAQGGLHGIAWSSLLPWSGPPLGISVLAVALGIAFSGVGGSEGAVFLAEEAGGSSRHMSRAVISCVAVCMVLYVITALAFVSGLGTAGLASAGTLGGSGVVSKLGTQYVGNWYGDLALFVLATSSLTAALAVMNSVSRLMFSWGRAGRAPAVFGRTHRQFQTPHIAVFALSLISLAFGVFGLILKGDGLAGGNVVFTWIFLFGVILILSVYAVLGVGALIWEWRRSRPGVVSPIGLGVRYAPALLLFVFTAATVYSQIHPAPVAPYNWAAYAAVIWLAVSAIVAFAWTRRAARAEAPNAFAP